MRQFENFDPQALIEFELLKHSHEKALIRKLFDFNHIVYQAAEQYRPSLLARPSNYVRILVDATAVVLLSTLNQRTSVGST